MNTLSLNEKEILSPVLLAYLKQKIKELGQEKNEAIIMESIKIVSDEIVNKQQLNAKIIKDELEEKLKNDLATKDFVRAESNQIRTEIAEMKEELKLDIAKIKQEITENSKKQLWFVISINAVSIITIIGANFALIKFLIDTFLKALSAK